MSKKLFSVFFAVLLALAFVACGGDDNNGNSSTSRSGSSPSTPPGSSPSTGPGSSSSGPSVPTVFDGTVNITGATTLGSTLTANFVGDEFFNNKLTYQWEIDGENVTTDGTSKNITATVEGDYFVKVKATGFSEGPLSPSASTRVIASTSTGLTGTAVITSEGTTLKCTFTGSGDAATATASKYIWFKGVADTFVKNSASDELADATSGVYYVVVQAKPDYIGMVRSEPFQVGPVQTQLILKIDKPIGSAETTSGVASRSFVSELYSGGKIFTLTRNSDTVISMNAGNTTARYYSSGWSTAAPTTDANYWQIHTFPGVYSQLTCDMNISGTAQGPSDFKLQYSYDGISYSDIPTLPTLTFHGTVTNADCLVSGKEIPSGTGTLSVRIVQAGAGTFVSGNTINNTANSAFKEFKLNGLYATIPEP